MSDRRTTCRYLRRDSNQCTGEAVDPDGEILLCTKHMARAVVLMQQGAMQRLARQKPTTTRRSKP